MAAPHSGAARPSNALRMLVPLHSRSTADRNLNYPTNQLTVTLALRLRLPPPRRLSHRDKARLSPTRRPSGGAAPCACPLLSW